MPLAPGREAQGCRELVRGVSRRLREADLHQRLVRLHADQHVRTRGRRAAKVNPVALGQVLAALAGACGRSLPVARPAVVPIEVLQDVPRELERLAIAEVGAVADSTG